MRTRPLTVTALALALVSGCGTDTEPTTAGSSPAVNADACRAYDNAIGDLASSIDGKDPNPFLIDGYAPGTVRKIRTAAQLTGGQPRAAMEQTALRVQVLADADWTSPGGGAAEAAAVRASISDVDRLCRAAGASLGNVPGPVRSG